jgi:hypothetical protein
VIGPSHSSLTFALIVYKLSNILLAIRPDHGTATVDPIVLPLSLVDLAINPVVSPISFYNVFPKFSNVSGLLWPYEFALSIFLASYVITTLFSQYPS